MFLLLIKVKSFLKAMIALKRKKRKDVRNMLGYLMSSTSVNETEIAGVIRWGMTLKLSCRKKKLPHAMKVLSWLLRTPC